jgi:plastocyanin
VRRHPLNRSYARLVTVIGLAVAVAGCQATSATTSAPADGVRIEVATAPGETLAFDPPEVQIGSVVPVTMTFRNRSSVAHNLTFTDGLVVATRTIVEPGWDEVLHIVPPAAGTYTFVCTIHAGMTGKLVVTASTR